MLVSSITLYPLICSNKQLEPTKTTQFFDEKQSSFFNAVAYSEFSKCSCGFDIKIRSVKNCTLGNNIKQ
jgi:hypothetical protein